MAGPNLHPNAHPSAGAYSNAQQVAANVAALGPRVAARGVSRLRHIAMLAETRIKANVSGRPGPRAQTGDYRRSWSTKFAARRDQVGATIGTNRPQGRRLEFGFVGADRIGRVFNQPPFPHFGEPAEQAKREVRQMLEELVEEGDL